jgi:hypothetical protein
LQKGDKRDLHGGAVVSDDEAQLHNADRAADAGDIPGQNSTHKNISAACERCDKTNREEERQEALQGSPPQGACLKVYTSEPGLVVIGVLRAASSQESGVKMLGCVASLP